MPRINEVIRRPLELIRQFLGYTALRRGYGDYGERIRIHVLEALDRVGYDTGISVYGRDVRKGFRGKTWSEQTAYVETPNLLTPQGTGAASASISPTTTRTTFLIPYEGASPTHYAAAYLDPTNRIRTLGNKDLSSVLKGILEENHRLGGKRIVPLRVEVIPVGFVRRGGRVEIYRELSKGEKGYLIVIVPRFDATDKELKYQTQHIASRILEELKNARLRKPF